ncbi:MAG: hypothetical protein ABJA67_18605, partial [Chthonomonadales bacterium]
PREGFPAPFPAVGIPTEIKPRCIYKRFAAVCGLCYTPDFGRFTARATGLLRKTCRARRNLPHTIRSRSETGWRRTGFVL